MKILFSLFSLMSTTEDKKKMQLKRRKNIEEEREKNMRNKGNSSALKDYIKKLEKENEALRDLIKEVSNLKNSDINKELNPIFKNAQSGGKKTKKSRKSRKTKKSRKSRK